MPSLQHLNFGEIDHSMAHPSKSVIILGTGSYTPEKVVSNDDMAKIVDTSDEWIRTRSGISQRRFAAENETTSDMACLAAEQAIESAKVKRDEIDLIIVATMTPDMPFPSTACLVQSKLKLPEVTAFDMQAACSGFVYALNTAHSMLLSGNFKTALVVGAEKMSSILDFQDRSTCVLFGDGAGAVILSAKKTTGDGPTGILGGSGGSNGANPSLLCQPGGGSAKPASIESVNNREHFVKMNGREIFKLAVRVMEQASIDTVTEFGYNLKDIDRIIPHQANMRIIDSLAKRLGVSMEIFYNNIKHYGNTSAASVPIALDEAIRDGSIKSGDLVLLVAFGAGLTWATSLIKWHAL